MFDVLIGLIVVVEEEVLMYDVVFVLLEWILVFFGFMMVFMFMMFIMMKCFILMVVLIFVLIVFGFFVGVGLGFGDMIFDFIGMMVLMVVLLMFVIMFFGIMIDVGFFDFFIWMIMCLFGDDLVKVVLGMVIFVGVVFLDGDGLMMFIIMMFVMLFIYLWFGMSFVVLMCVVGFMNGILNIVLWGGFIVWVVIVFGF